MAERAAGRPVPKDFPVEAQQSRQRGERHPEPRAASLAFNQANKDTWDFSVWDVENNEQLPLQGKGTIAEKQRCVPCFCGIRGASPCRIMSCTVPALGDDVEKPKTEIWSDVVFSRLVINSEGEPIALKYEHLQDLLKPVWLYYIESYLELRIYFAVSRYLNLPPPLGMHHTIVFLELANCGYDISVEKYQNSLELMIGERAVMHAHVPRIRATGAPRMIAPGCSIRLEPNVAIGPNANMPLVCVGDFFRWIVGPLRKGWRPYNLVYANCQHFASELQQFLHGEVTVNVKTIDL